MATAEHKDFAQADEVREFTNGQVELLHIGGSDIGRLVLRPGWRWSEHVKPIAGTDLCQAPHFQYHVAGMLRIQMADGTSFDAVPGQVNGAAVWRGRLGRCRATSPSSSWGTGGAPAPTPKSSHHRAPRAAGPAPAEEAEAARGEQVGARAGAGIGRELDDGVADLARGEERAGPVQVRGHVQALAAAYAATAAAPSVVAGVSCGSTEMNLMPRRSRSDWAAA